MKARGAAPLLVGSFVMAMTIVVFAAIFLPNQSNFVWPFNPLTRLFEFVLGMAACRWWIRERAETKSTSAWTGFEFLSLVACGGLVVGIPFLIHGLDAASLPAFWFGSEISVVGFAALIWVFAHQAGAISRALSSRFCEWFGEISFALYMCHQIILRWLNPKVMTGTWEATQFFLPYLLGSGVVAAVIFHLVETPVRRAIVTAFRRTRDTVV
jgi:peptidoglycan/LPS O-acetylase OafA/YrhL